MLNPIGDSGGPILDSNNVQLGVTSWAIGCGEEGKPGVYARISSAIDWIDEMIDKWSDFPDSVNASVSSVDNEYPKE